MNLSESTMVVTGATNGIGKAICHQLVGKGVGHLIMVSRTQEKAISVRQELKSPNTNISIIQADFSSLEQVRKAGAEITTLAPSLDVLINNAGAYFHSWGETSDGLEQTMGVNHFAPFLLTYLLQPSILQGEEGRIINVSSNAHFEGTIDPARFRGRPDKYSGWRSYAQSKLANVLFTYQLASLLWEHNVSVNCLHPGMVNTSIGNRHTPGYISTIWSLAKPFFLSKKSGADTPVFLATSEKGQELTGRYFVKRKAVKSSDISYDQTLQNELWEISCQLLNIEWHVESP